MRMVVLAAAALSGSGPSAQIPGYAAALAQAAPVLGPRDWARVGAAGGWPALVRAAPAERQPARWAYAARMIDSGLWPEALGALEAMRAADPDLDLVPAFQLARGAALTALDRPTEALTQLGAPDLAGNPEGCAWRLRAYAASAMAPEALLQVDCALAAINGRHGARRAPFVLAAADMALAAGRPAQAIQWLRALADTDADANLRRARALAALGQPQPARLRYERARQAGGPEARIAARLGLVELGLAQGTLAPADAARQVDTLRFEWRGGTVERHALELGYRLATDAHDLPRALQFGAALLRYFATGADAAPLLAQMQAMLASLLAPEAQLPLTNAAGLYWEYREFTPAGAEGDALVHRLADKLQAVGLPGRAAELLQYQLTARTSDVARGPLSVKVALLHILAGHADRALEVLRTTEDANYTPEMRFDRKRMEAVALFQTGKPAAASAALQDVPDAAGIRAEIAWKQRDWNALADGSTLPPPGALNQLGQAVVLRHAIALAMLGREDRLAALRQRYSAAFRALPSAAAFDVLTRSIGTVDPATVSKAMAAIPDASPAGAIADLIDLDPDPAP